MRQGENCVGCIASDDFERRPAKHLFGLGVPLRDVTGPVHRDHRVKGCIDNQAGAGLILVQRRFHFRSFNEEPDLASGSAQCFQQIPIFGLRFSAEKLHDTVDIGPKPNRKSAGCVQHAHDVDGGARKHGISCHILHPERFSTGPTGSWQIRSGRERLLPTASQELLHHGRVDRPVLHTHDRLPIVLHPPEETDLPIKTDHNRL